MKREIIFLFLFPLLSLCTACEEEVVYCIGEEIPAPYVPLGEITLQMNSHNVGCSACDSAHIYFQHPEEGHVRLYKKHRATGELTLLLEREQPDAGEGQKPDVIFANFHLRGGYLYFELFDWNASEYHFCRISTRGDAPVEKIADMSEIFNSVLYAGGKAYIVRDNTFQSIDLDSGRETDLFTLSDGFDPLFILDGYLYYLTYRNDAGFHTLVCRIRLDGSADECIYEGDEDEILTAAILEDRMYIHTAYGGVLYSMDLDGKNLRTELDEVAVSAWNAGRDALYMVIGEDRTYDPGVYVYRPGYRMPIPVYLGETPAWYLMLNGYGEIIMNKDQDANRFGQLCIIRDGEMIDIK